ncbi:MAG: hypothetical protein CMC08_09955 [Flavobacteriaceae bacterium]|nr:hypothetical protein [Flavobacteriaceae bacterium]|tara:strand:+ start:907 stop:1422 length:516 start_codon:yes stop_codon:yes gene_type:complete
MRQYTKKHFKNNAFIGILTIAVIALLSCKGSANGNSKIGETVSMEDKTIPFTVLAEGQHSNFETKTRKIITTQAELEALVAQLNENRSPGMSVPEVDFKISTVIFASSGQLSSGGFTVAVEKIIETEDSLEVYIGGTSPAPGDYVTSVLTSPYVLIKVDEMSKKIIFNERN